MDRKASFRCRKCRMVLFNNDIITNAHSEDVRLDKDEDAGLDSCASDDGTIWFLKEDSLPEWLHKFIEESSWIKGKILCPKCGLRLGSFDFVSGAQCICKQMVLPAVHIKKGKVDCHFEQSPQNQELKMQRPIPPSFVLMNHAGRYLSQNQEATSSSTVDDDDLLDSKHTFNECGLEKVAPSQDQKSNESNDEEGQGTNCSDQSVFQPTEDLLCPVCLEVYYEATACLPCGHIFCEPCLRNLGKKKPTATACPLCRQLIQQCLPQPGLRKTVALKYPHLYKDRKLFEQKIPTGNFPLPWQPGYHFRRQSDPLMQDQHYLLQNLLFSIPADDSTESGTLTFSASSLIVVVSLLTVFIITLLAGYLCIRYFVVGILDMSFEETRYVVFVIFHLFVAFIIRWYFQFQVRSSIGDASH